MEYKVVKDWKVLHPDDCIVMGDWSYTRWDGDRLYDINDPENYTTLRSTWLKDNNGVEIWEGDRVAYRNSLKDRIEKVVKYWPYSYEEDYGGESGMIWFYLHPIGVCESIIDYELEVIGNIYISD